MVCTIKYRLPLVIGCKGLKKLSINNIIFINFI